MAKILLTVAALVVLTACNSFDPVSAAAQDRHNEMLKATIGPDGAPLTGTTTAGMTGQ